MMVSYCDHCKKHYYEENDCWLKDRPQCCKCKKFGHAKKRRNKTGESVNLAHVAKEENCCFNIGEMSSNS